jgi:proteasome inhibitor subunit 1 (PI31)
MDNWQELDDEYAFVYTNPERSSKKVLVKCLAMHNKLLVDALAKGASELVHLEISVGDYAGENGGNYSSQFKNLEELVKSLDAQILFKLDGSSQPISSSNDSSDHSSEYEAPINPIGGSDLFPWPGAGMYPTRGDFGIGGSMLLGPNDPHWLGGVAGDPAFPGGQLGETPCACFDPYGPPGVPGFEPNPLSRGPRRPGSGTHPDLEYFGTHPDLDFI